MNEKFLVCTCRSCLFLFLFFHSRPKNSRVIRLLQRPSPPPHTRYLFALIFRGRLYRTKRPCPASAPNVYCKTQKMFCLLQNPLFPLQARGPVFDSRPGGKNPFVLGMGSRAGKFVVAVLRESEGHDFIFE